MYILHLQLCCFVIAYSVKSLMIPSLFCETPLIMAQVDQNMLQVKNGWGVSNSSVLG